MKRLYRDHSNEMLAGVCSGIAEYLDVDPTIIRLVFVLFTFLGGGGLWIYLVLWIIMPEKPVALTSPVDEMEKPDQTAIAVKEPQPVKQAAEKKIPAKKSTAKSKTSAKKTPAKKSPTTRKSSGASKAKTSKAEGAEKSSK